MEQIGCVLVPQIMKGDLDGFQQRVWEHVGAVPVPQIWELVGEVVQLSPQERVQNCTQEQITEFPVPQILEAVGQVLPSTPQDRVHNRTRKLFVDVPVPHIKEKIAGKVKCTGKVFTVPHHRDDRACTLDTVGLRIKGLDKFNLPRVGDVMVSAPQITKGNVGRVEQVVSWFDRKSQVAADEPLYLF